METYIHIMKTLVYMLTYTLIYNHTLTYTCNQTHSYIIINIFTHKDTHI